MRHRRRTKPEDGKTVREEVEQRVVEMGIALCASYHLDWQPSYSAVGKLGDLLGPLVRPRA